MGKRDKELEGDRWPEQSHPDHRSAHDRIVDEQRAQAAARDLARRIRELHEPARRPMGPVMYMSGGVLLEPPCAWLPADVGHAAELVVRAAQGTIGTREDVGRPNRGPRIDAWLRASKVPENVIRAGKGYWCAAWAGEMWRAGGVVPPEGYFDCDVWWRWARQTGHFSRHTASLGAVVLYGDEAKRDAKHVGIVIDANPQLPPLTAEANTTVEGSALERNGTAVALKLVQPSDPVLGYVHLVPVAGA